MLAGTVVVTRRSHKPCRSLWRASHSWQKNVLTKFHSVSSRVTASCIKAVSANTFWCYMRSYNLPVTYVWSCFAKVIRTIIKVVSSKMLTGFMNLIKTTSTVWAGTAGGPAQSAHSLSLTPFEFESEQEEMTSYSFIKAESTSSQSAASTTFWGQFLFILIQHSPPTWRKGDISKSVILEILK